MIQTGNSCFRLKIIPDDTKQIQLQELMRNLNHESLEGFWDPVEKEQVNDIDECPLNDNFEWTKPLSDDLTLEIASDDFLAACDYRGEATTPIYPKYNCKIPIRCFKRPKFNETWLSYKANPIEIKSSTLQYSSIDFSPILPNTIFDSCHRTNKSILVRNGLKFEVEGRTGSYCVINILSQEDLTDFLSMNFFHLKKIISFENEKFSEEKVHKLACMYTAVRYVAFVGGYFGNDNPSHWKIIEEEAKERITPEVIQEILSMRSDVFQLIIATTAEWWVADFSVGAEGKFPPFLKKIIMSLETLKPIFKDLALSDREMQLLVHKAIHLVDRRNVLKAINMDNDEWTGEVPAGLPVIKKIDLGNLKNPEISEMSKRAPAGCASYSNCHKVLDIIKRYKLAKFIFYKHESKLVNSALTEIMKKPNYHHINCAYLNKNDSRFTPPKTYHKRKIRNIVLECGIFLLFTGCHRGLLHSPIFESYMPSTMEEIAKISPNWLIFLHDFINNKTRIEQVEKGCEKESKNRPFSLSPRSILMKEFASTFKISNEYLYWIDENGILLFVGPVDRSKGIFGSEEKFCEGFNELFLKSKK